MNPLLTKLQPYPFERLKQLFQSVTPNTDFKPISLGIGEPKHATPEFIKTALSGALDGLAAYPATAGEPALREAFAAWLLKRYALTINPATQVLPVNGSREALFAFTQVIVDTTKTTVANGVTQLPIVVCPNPFYQIYEGAALLAGAEPYYVNSDPARNFGVDWDSVPAEIWERTQMIFVCSPGNPAGAVMPLLEWKKLFDLSDRYGFVIASDECYSEIYFHDGVPPPLGGLEAAYKCGRTDFKNIVSFTSLSKRSNVPGMRSGFCAGDVPHLPRQRHEPGGASGQQSGVERRSARGCQSRPVPRQIHASHAPFGRSAGGRPARCRLLPLGKNTSTPEIRRRRIRQNPACPIQCDGIARQLLGA
jgi:N-succinyldiaminopimelate aminotransferase